MSDASDPRTSVSRRGFMRAVGLTPALFQAVGTSAEEGSKPAADSFWHSPRHSGVLLADLSGAEPREAISPKPRKGCWYTIPYRTQTGIQGVMVARGQLTHPPDLRLSLPVQGWHAIYVGLFGGSRVDEFRLRLKLSDETLFETLAPSRLGYQRQADGSWLRPRAAIGVTDIEEVFWKAADLGGQQLVISHLRTSHPSVAQLAFVRLVPLTAEEVREYQRAGGRPETRLLAAEMDGQGPFHTGARTVQDIQENLEPLRGTDVGKLFLGTGGIGAGQTLYPSRVGAMMGAGEEDFPVEAGRRAAESLRGFQSRGIDPLKVAVDHAHSMGIEVYLGFRMGTMASMPPVWFEPVRFWKRHPQWRCRDREGQSVVRLSLAYSQVRRFYVDLLAELAGYGVKGVQLIYTRRPPFVLFEPPVVEDFKKAYGIDPRQLPEPVQRRGIRRRQRSGWRGTGRPTSPPSCGNCAGGWTGSAPRGLGSKCWPMWATTPPGIVTPPWIWRPGPERAWWTSSASIRAGTGPSGWITTISGRLPGAPEPSFMKTSLRETCLAVNTPGRPGGPTPGEPRAWPFGTAAAALSARPNGTPSGGWAIAGIWSRWLSSRRDIVSIPSS